jgi:hypothetical protein
LSPSISPLPLGTAHRIVDEVAERKRTADREGFDHQRQVGFAHHIRVKDVGNVVAQYHGARAHRADKKRIQNG